MYKEILIKRNELYELVWSKPMTEIAKQYNVSDKAIAKICDKLNVPVPGLGYWRKVEVGIQVEKVALSKIPDIYPTTHTIRKYEPDFDFTISDEAQKLIDYVKDPNNKILVPEKTSKLNSLIKDTELSLEKSFRKKRFLESRKGDRLFNISVSPESKRRAFRILNTLIKEFEARNFKVYVKNGFIYIWILGTELAIFLKEKSKRIELPQKSPSYFKDYDFIPTSELILSIEDIYIHNQIRKNFTDNRTGKLEEKLNDFMVALIIASQAKLADEKRIEENHKKWEEEERKRKEMIELIKKEESKVEELYKNVERWHKSKIIRDYFEEYKRVYLNELNTEDEKDKILDCIKWGLEQADRVSPFVKSPYSIIDEKKKYFKYL